MSTTILISAFDLERIAYEGIKNELFDAAVEFLEQLVRKSEEEKKLGIETIDHLFQHKVDVHKYKIHLSTTKKVHDDRLDKRGQFSRQRRCNQYPFDPELRKKKKFKKGYNATLITSRGLVKQYMHSAKVQGPVADEFMISTQLQVDKLCRGGQLRVIRNMIVIYCVFHLRIIENS